MRVLRRCFVDMERLRIVARGVGLDVGRGERVAAEAINIADADILEEIHGAVPGWRRPNIVGTVIETMTASASSIIS